MSAVRGRPRPRAPRRMAGDDIDVEQCWAELAQSLGQILTRDHSELSFEHLYRNSYKLVLKKKGDILYSRFKLLETDWLQQNVQPPILKNIQGTLLGLALQASTDDSTDQKRIAGEQLMKALRAAWEDHILCMSMTTDVLMYMDRVYCDEQRKLKIYPLTMGLFRDCVLYAQVSAKDKLDVLRVLVEVVLLQIQLERKGDIVDQTLIRSCMYMLEGLYETDQEDESTKLYLTRFEKDFLKASREFYRHEGRELLKTVNAGSYCRHVGRRIIEEQERCQRTLPAMTLDEIRNVIEDELIRATIKEVIELPGSGVEFMLDNNRIDDLVLMFDLVARVDPKKTALKAAVQKRIVELGMEINEAAIVTSAQQPAKADGDGKAAPEKPVNQQTVAAIAWVENVLQLKERYDKVLSQAFRDDKGLQTAFTISFTEFINKFERKSEYLSLFFDENMKKGNKSKTETETDALIQKGIVLLQYIQDKDMFERYYKKHLARRLILKRSASMDAEKQILVKMKMEIGNALTARIEPMFKDIDVSDELTTNFKKYSAGLGSADTRSSDLDIHVLTNTMWPLESLTSGMDDVTSQCNWPSVLEKVKSSFENFYLTKHSGRKLTWLANMGTVDIRAHFPGAKSTSKYRELNCSTYAAIVLLLFNDLPEGEKLTFEEIQARTNIPKNDLVRNLQSLAVAPKTRVLLKEPMSREIKPDDKFSFNSGFDSKFQKIKIGVVASNKVESIVERKQTEQKNDDSRVIVVEAAIVRVMKQRKTLSHGELVTEVVTQLLSRFKPDLAMVKKRIESLIEREYLERMNDAEKPAYRYLA